MRKITGVLLAGVLVLSLISCYMKTEHKIEAHITIDIRELKETATQIEDMVRSKKDKGDQSFFSPIGNFQVFTTAFWRVEEAYAGMQIKFMTPEIQAAIDRRGARLDRVEELMLKGCIGENNRGYVAYRPCPACTSDQGLLKEVKKVIKEENKDRKAIYMAILEQNNLSLDALPNK